MSCSASPCNSQPVPNLFASSNTSHHHPFSSPSSIIPALELHLLQWILKAQLFYRGKCTIILLDIFSAKHTCYYIYFHIPLQWKRRKQSKHSLDYIPSFLSCNSYILHRTPISFIHIFQSSAS